MYRLASKGACLGSTYKGVDAMGRGRQKAKQTKVARELKYYSPNTDYSALQKELGNGEAQPEVLPADEGEAGQDEQDEYADWAPDGRH